MTSTEVDAPHNALFETANEAAWALTDGVGRERAFAVMVAALTHEGWSGKPAKEVLAYAMDGYDGADLIAAQRAAGNVTSPWLEFEEGGSDAVEASKVMRRLLRQCEPVSAEMADTKGTQFDLDAAPVAPPWLVQDFLVRGKTHMLSGPTHAMKTGLREAMMASSLTGRPFLGREVPSLRWMILDGENSQDDLAARWKALGLGQEHWPSIHLTTRETGVRLGEPEWDDWLRRAVEDFKPDVLVIDTIVRVCSGVASRDEDSVAALYANVLVPLVDRHNLALLFTAHHRKAGGRAGTDDAVLGSAQWAGQADQTMTVAPTGPLSFQAEPDGTTATHRPFVLRRPKGRTLVSNDREHFDVRGRLNSEGALVEFSVLAPTSEPTTTERIVAALEAPLGTGALAKELDLHRTGARFRTALEDAMDSGLITKREDGLYERTDQ